MPKIERTIDDINPGHRFTRYGGFTMTHRFADQARRSVEDRLAAWHALSPWAREFMPRANTLREQILTLQRSLGLEPREIVLPKSGPELEAWVAQAETLVIVLIDEKRERDESKQREQKRLENEREERERLTDSAEELQDRLLFLYENESFNHMMREEAKSLLGIRWLGTNRRQLAPLSANTDELISWIVRAEQLKARIEQEVLVRKAEEERIRHERDEQARLVREKIDEERRAHKELHLAKLAPALAGLRRIMNVKSIRGITPEQLTEARDTLFVARDLQKLGLLDELQHQLLTKASATVESLERIWGFGPGVSKPGWKEHRPVRHYRHR